MNKLNKNNTIIPKLTLYFAVSIALFLSFYNIFVSYLIIGFGVLTISQLNFKRRFSHNFSKENIFLFWSQLSLFFIFILAIFFSKNTEKSIDIVIMRLSIIFFPVFFSLTGKSFGNKKQMFLKLFVLGAFIASVVLIAIALYKSISFTDNKFEFNYYFVQDKASYFKYTYFSKFKHPAYFSMYLNFSVLILFYFIKHNKSTKKKLLNYLLIAFFVVIIFLLSSKAGLIIIIAILFLNLLRYFSKKRTFLLKIIIFISFLSFSYFISQNSRFVKMYNQVEESIKLGKKSENYPERLILWENSVDIIKQNFWFGTTPADAQVEINKNLLKFDNYVQKKDIEYNSHNQYLQTFVESGIVGFLLLLFIFGGSIVLAIKRKQTLFLGFLFIVILNFFFESMLNTFAGIVFIFYFLNYFIFIFKKEKTQ